jgi:hypothetical protein
MRLIGQLLDVEKARTRDVRGQVFGTGVAAARWHEQARIHHDEIRLAKVVGEPLRRDQIVHRGRIGLRAGRC